MLTKAMKRIMQKKVKAFLTYLGYQVNKKSRMWSNSFNAQQELIKGLHRHNITIFDVGANKGQTAEKYHGKFPNAEIYCFEPFPDSVISLKKKFCNDARVHIVPKAVSEKSGRTTFYVNELDETNSLLPRPISDRRYYPKKAELKNTIEVEVIALDDFISDNDIKVVDILKFDIQGGELMALNGARNLLKTGGVLLIYTEIMFIPHYEGSPLFHEIWSFLVSYGYSLFDIYNVSRATNGQIRYGDAIFVNESLRDAVIDKYPDEP